MNVLVRGIRLLMRIARTEPLASKLALKPHSTETTTPWWPGDADPDKACVCVHLHVAADANANAHARTGHGRGAQGDAHPHRPACVAPSTSHALPPWL